MRVTPAGLMTGAAASRVTRYVIGRRIIASRPYGSPEELVTRRVLKRATYEAIQNPVAVR
jgi:hypothetical protein